MVHAPGVGERTSSPHYLPYFFWIVTFNVLYRGFEKKELSHVPTSPHYLPQWLHGCSQRIRIRDEMNHYFPYGIMKLSFTRTVKDVLP